MSFLVGKTTSNLKASSKTDFIRKNLPPNEYTAFGGKFFLLKVD